MKGHFVYNSWRPQVENHWIRRCETRLNNHLFLCFLIQGSRQMLLISLRTVPFLNILFEQSNDVTTNYAADPSICVRDRFTRLHIIWIQNAMLCIISGLRRSPGGSCGWEYHIPSNRLLLNTILIKNINNYWTAAPRLWRDTEH